MTPSAAPLSGRQAEAARNDQLILDAAREVFIADPAAPVSEVARRAGVGIAALYRRYPSKEEMLRKLCADGLQRYIAEIEAALAGERDPWTAFAGFMDRIVAADTHSLTQRLAGTFTPTEDLYREAARAQELNVTLFERVRGLLRPGVVVDDIAWMLEMVAAIRLGDPERTAQMRQRYLTLLLDGLRGPAVPLPGPPPRGEEMGARWTT
jgi:AcrR family transcriptional regulator